ncbi:rab-protein geranylgeranyltransferase [Kockovaella imperatae]|uniref:Geranylgeranyl transferase type-2 subunit alpha n=1 Tax=Kockovaella imperatae TaxID=4999 RepID=A0A1Y1UGN0_9TREE|nr:rab-protein geranylgeranyltransferase [Kockovaella imperatae]ORX37188.1 rab-protein geranylgeranyltransferase [Kockovaella imperatae]
MQHGVKRTHLSGAAAEAKNARNRLLLEKYVALEETVLQKRRRKEYTRDALEITNELLDMNPEYYTVWNYRRHILRGLFPTLSDEKKVQILGNEIRLTTSYLQVNPKVYWIWNHRRWCLESIPEGPDGSEGWKNSFWKIELELIEQLLRLDPRNFHAWGYRRTVIAGLPKSFPGQSSPRDEIRFTTKKIESNFSNFSAWHYRIQLFTGIWRSMTAEAVEGEKREEFDFVRQALWTDPADQSAWLYHRWLIGTDSDEDTLKSEVKSIRELHETEPDSKWCMNALAHYERMLSATSSEVSSNSCADAVALMARLEEIDPQRISRYRDWVAEVK